MKTETNSQICKLAKKSKTSLLSGKFGIKVMNYFTIIHISHNKNQICGNGKIQVNEAYFISIHPVFAGVIASVAIWF